MCSLLFTAKSKKEPDTRVRTIVSIPERQNSPDRKQIGCASTGRGDTRDILGMMEMFHVMVMLKVTGMHTFVKTHRIVTLKQAHFVACKIGFNEVEWMTSELDRACAPFTIYLPFPLEPHPLLFSRLSSGYTNLNFSIMPGRLLPWGLFFFPLKDFLFAITLARGMWLSNHFL